MTYHKNVVIHSLSSKWWNSGVFWGVVRTFSNLWHLVVSQPALKLHGKSYISQIDISQLRFSIKNFLFLLSKERGRSFDVCYLRSKYPYLHNTHLVGVCNQSFIYSERLFEIVILIELQSFKCTPKFWNSNMWLNLKLNMHDSKSSFLKTKFGV